MSSLINPHPSTILSGFENLINLDYLIISRNLTKITDSTTFKAISEIITLITIFTATIIWIFAI